MLQKFIKSSVARLGLDPGLFSSHSLCRAGASWAFAAQVPGELIKMQGDWTSEAYLHYLEFSIAERCQVAQGMTMEITMEGLWNDALSLLLQVVGRSWYWQTPWGSIPRSLVPWSRPTQLTPWHGWWTKSGSKKWMSAGSHRSWCT